MRKTIKYLPAALVLLALPFLFGFTDMDESHWANGAVTRLVEEGAVSGFEDGSFRPNEPVTRAQFVKMTGYRTDSRSEGMGYDISQSHWSYDYLAHSPIRLVLGRMLPDEPMTREQAAVCLYDCFGNNAPGYAPNIVLGDTQNRTEIGWAYEHGIMVGSDGINLRLSDTLTRAEAATLIVNSRSKLNSTSDFADNVSPEVLERVFNSSYLFDKPYDENAVLTNGEIARAAYRLRIDELGSLWYIDDPLFDHEYASDITAMEYLLGEENMTAQFASAPADMKNTLALMAYGMAAKVKIPHGYGDEEPTYTDFSASDNELSKALSFSFRNGIIPFAGGVMRGEAAVTHKIMAGILLQYDAMCGLATSVSTDGRSFSYADEPMRFSHLPQNEADYAVVLKNVPDEVYEAAYILPESISAEDFVKPYINYRYHSTLKRIHASYQSDIASLLADKYGAEVRFTFYSPLVYDDGESFIARVKAEVVSLGNARGVEELFADFRIISKSDECVWLEIPVPFTEFIGG